MKRLLFIAFCLLSVCTLDVAAQEQAAEKADNCDPAICCPSNPTCCQEAPKCCEDLNNCCDLAKADQSLKDKLFFWRSDKRNAKKEARSEDGIGESEPMD